MVIKVLPTFLLLLHSQVCVTPLMKLHGIFDDYGLLNRSCKMIKLVYLTELNLCFIVLCLLYNKSLYFSYGISPTLQRMTLLRLIRFMVDKTANFFYFVKKAKENVFKWQRSVIPCLLIGSAVDEWIKIARSHEVFLFKEKKKQFL